MTELIWDGKYDATGRRTAPLRVALPFQTVETVNESAADRTRTLDLFAAGKPAEWKNRLIWGDKKYVLPSLLPEFAGKVDLVYIDPPFVTGSDFSVTTQIPDDGGALVKGPNAIEQKAYRDTWGKGLDSYLQWFYETASFLRELLAENGSIYVHLDWHVGHYAKAVLDEVFGYDNFRNEIVWKRQTAHSDAKRYGPIHDTILYYSKSDQRLFNPQHVPYDDSYIVSHYSLTDSDGRRYQLGDLTAPGPRPGLQYTFRGVDPPRGRVWAVLPEKMEELDRQGLVVFTTGKTPRRKRYLDEMEGLTLQDVWTDVHAVNSQAGENARYPTQKPEALLERIIKASSNPGDLVLDCFCGSGTTATVAEKLGRRWITADLGRFAVHTARKRLLAIPDVKPFAVQNLGKYERQAWAASEFGDTAVEKQAAYRRWMLDLYRAEPLPGGTWLHGAKGGRLVHVGGVDGPVTPGDVAQIAAEFRRVQGTGEDAPVSNGIDLLGWDFAFELNEVAHEQSRAAGLALRFLRIPRDVMDPRAVKQGDVKFFELGALAAEATATGRDVTVRLTDFLIPPDDVPEAVRARITHWSQWIDYWAVDWDYQGDAFHNQWQAYRTKAAPKLPLEARATVETPGPRRIVVKVIDLLGNDTTKTLDVSVA